MGPIAWRMLCCSIWLDERAAFDIVVEVFQQDRGVQQFGEFADDWEGWRPGCAEKVGVFVFYKMAVVGVPLGIPIRLGPVIPVLEAEIRIVLLTQRNTLWTVFRKTLLLRALYGLWHGNYPLEVEINGPFQLRDACGEKGVHMIIMRPVVDTILHASKSRFQKRTDGRLEIGQIWCGDGVLAVVGHGKGVLSFKSARKWLSGITTDGSDAHG
jgi:hypothetical protein